MLYVEILLLLAFAAFLFAFPKWLYKNKKFRKVWLGLAYSYNYRLFVARMLSLVLLLFHVVYFAIFPRDWGIIISSLYVFFSLASHKNLKLLMALRSSQLATSLIAVLAIFWAFFPNLLSVSITMAFIVEAVFCLPTEAQISKAEQKELTRSFKTAAIGLRPLIKALDKEEREIEELESEEYGTEEYDTDEHGTE